MKNRIFIGGLSFSTTESSLRDKLSEYGQVISIRIVRDHETGKSKGFGFATFDDEEGAALAIEKLDNTILDDRRIGVQIAVNRSGNR